MALSHPFKEDVIDDGPLSSFQGRSSSASSFHACLLQTVDGVISLALYLRVVSQAPRHFREPRTREEPTGGGGGGGRERACTERCKKQNERDVSVMMAGVGKVGAMKVVMGGGGGGGGRDGER